MEEVTNDFVKEEEQAVEDIIINLENETERKELLDSLKSNSMFFKPEENKTYKVEIVSPHIKEVQAIYNKGKENEQITTKHELAIKSKCSDGSDFEGVWQVGTTVLKPILCTWEKGAIYNVSVSGIGTDRKYSVSKDF